jgi:hypothetical protein
LVFSIKATFAYMIPDIPTHIFVKLQRDRYLARKERMQLLDEASKITDNRVKVN